MLHLNTGGAFSIIQTAYDDRPSIKLLFEWFIALVMMCLAPGMQQMLPIVVVVFLKDTQY